MPFVYESKAALQTCDFRRRPPARTRWPLRGAGTGQSDNRVQGPAPFLGSRVNGRQQNSLSEASWLHEEVIAACPGARVLMKGQESSSLAISGVSHDSRVVRDGDLFACIGGKEHDGHSTHDKRGLRWRSDQCGCHNHYKNILLCITKTFCFVLQKHFENF